MKGGLKVLVYVFSLTLDKGLPAPCDVEMLPKTDSEQCASSSKALI